MMLIILYEHSNFSGLYVRGKFCKGFIESEPDVLRFVSFRDTSPIERANFLIAKGETKVLPEGRPVFAEVFFQNRFWDVNGIWWGLFGAFELLFGLRFTFVSCSFFCGVFFASGRQIMDSAKEILE